MTDSRLPTNAAQPAVGVEGGPVVGGLRPPLDDSTVGLAARLVNHMNVTQMLDVWAEEEQRAPGGRPELFSKYVVLVAMVVCVLTDQPLELIQVCDVMFRQLGAKWRRDLDIPDPPASDDVRAWKARYRCVRTRFHGIISLIDPSPLPKNRRLDDEAFQAKAARRQAARTPEDWDRRDERLEWFANQVIEATMMVLPRDVRRRWKGSIGVDATVVPSFARGPKRAHPAKRRGERPAIALHSVDPDAGWYSREKDDRDESPEVGAGLDTPIYGFEATLVVAGDEKAEASFPSIVMGMAVLDRPGHAVGANGTRAVASVRARRHPAHYLAADRAYSSAKAQDFQLRVRSLGYGLVCDYKRDQLGVKADACGFIQVEGEWYCPMMPQALIDASADCLAKRTDGATRDRRVEERKIYSARLKQRPDADGYERRQCPAAGLAPGVRCELKPRSVARAPAGSHRVVLDTQIRAAPPACCTQESVTIAPDAGAKFAQALPYATPEWKRVYNTLRNSTEGANGFLKDPAHEALEDAGRRRVHGVAAQTVFTAFLILAANIRKIRRFLERRATEAGKLRRLPRRRHSRSSSPPHPSLEKAPFGSGTDPPSSA